MSKIKGSKEGTAKGIIGKCIMCIFAFFIISVLTAFFDSILRWIMIVAFALVGGLAFIRWGDSTEEAIDKIGKCIMCIFAFLFFVFIMSVLVIFFDGILGWIIIVAFALVGGLVFIQWVKSTEEAMDKIGKVVALGAAALFVVLFVVFVLFIFSDDMEIVVRYLLDVNMMMNKIKIIELLGWMMSGVLAVAGVVGLNRRAEAQVKDNILVEKGHTQERTKTATKHLGHDKASVRIAAFYEFVQLANDNKKYRESILKILYAHIRATTTDSKYNERVLMTGKPKPTEEIQGLLDGLFRSNEIERGDVKINLQRSYLPGADLIGVNLSKANLVKADLSEANLYIANLFEAGLLGANLSKAILSKASLHKANLHRANLSKANLSGADLSGTDLSEVDLSGADLSGADFSEADLSDARLENASYTNETKFPKWLEEWLESQQINPDNDGKKHVPAGFVAPTSPRIGE